SSQLPPLPRPPPFPYTTLFRSSLVTIGTAPSSSTTWAVTSPAWSAPSIGPYTNWSISSPIAPSRHHRICKSHPIPKSPISRAPRSEDHTSELQSPYDLVCRLLL